MQIKSCVYEPRTASVSIFIFCDDFKVTARPFQHTRLCNERIFLRIYYYLSHCMIDGNGRYFIAVHSLAMWFNVNGTHAARLSLLRIVTLHLKQIAPTFHQQHNFPWSLQFANHILKGSGTDHIRSLGFIVQEVRYLRRNGSKISKI